MRRYGVENAYEQLKALTRGQRVDPVTLRAFIAELPIPEEAKAALRELSPSLYIGYARQLASTV